MLKMKYVLTIAAAFLVMAAFTVADDTETRTLGEFDKLDVSTGVTVTLVHGNSNKVEIETEGVETSEVVTEIDDNELEIKFKKSNNWGKKRRANVTLTYKSIESIDVSSGSTIKSENTLNADDLELDVSSGATVQLEIACNELEIDISSGATVRLSGNCNSQNVDISSGATYRANELGSKTASIDASSGASAQVWVTENLTASASSGGSVKYKGDPKQTNIDKSYSGSIKKA